MHDFPGRILVYVHCPRIIVNSTQFHSQKVLANYGYSKYIVNYIVIIYLIFYKFSVQSETGNTNCH